MLWCQSGERRTSFAIASAATTLVAAAALLPTLYLEHRHTLRSSSFIAIWLIATIFCDATRARSLFLRDLRQVAILATVSAVIKGIIFCLEEVPKTRWIMDEETKKNTGKQAASGFVSRSLFLWINGMFYAGSKGVLKLEDLDSLGPSLASDHLLEHFHKFWTSGMYLEIYALLWQNLLITMQAAGLYPGTYQRPASEPILDHFSVLVRRDSFFPYSPSHNLYCSRQL